MPAVWRAMLNSPMLSIFQHFHTIPLRSPLISLRSKWRLTGFSRRFTPKNPVRLHNPFGQLPRWGAKNVLPLNLIALPARGGWRYENTLYSKTPRRFPIFMSRATPVEPLEPIEPAPPLSLNQRATRLRTPSPSSMLQ